MTTHDNDTATSTADVASRNSISEIAEMLMGQGFEVRRSDCEGGGRLTITNAPKGRCEIDVHDSGWVNCGYFPWVGESAPPADISRAVERLLAVPPDDPAIEHVDSHPKITLKGAVGSAMRARGLPVELQLSVDEVDFTVYAELEISNPDQPGRGTVSITDDGVQLG
jgi:hypothetical protein